MKLSATFSGYLAKTYIVNFIWLLLALLAVIYLFDTVELIRRASNREGVPLMLVLQMGLLKLPEVGQVLLPFAVLFSAMFTFWGLTRRHELVVARAAGFSVWQFLAPVIGVAIAAGVLQMAVVNPVGALLVGKFEQLERTYLNREKSQVAVFKEGLWLRQARSDEQGYIILHAATLNQQVWKLNDVTVLIFGEGDTFERRVDAQSARLEPGRWVFVGVSIYDPPGESRTLEQAELPTDLTIKDVEDSFASPETMSFWRLPAHIQTLEETGFDASSLRVHYHNLLAQPLLFAAMILLAAAVSTRPPRLRGTGILMLSGLFIGFFVFFMSSFLQALGASGQLPAVLAAWSPALICTLLGLSVIMALEDG